MIDTEKFRGRPLWKKQLFLKSFVNNMGRVDLGFNGNRYTWTSRQEGLALIKKRLNRAIANDTWMLRSPKAMVIHLE